MIPLVLTTGFLGSGKTTLLRRIAERESGSRLVFLVNEFSQLDVDAKLLETEGLEAVSIAGGSIFPLFAVPCMVGMIAGTFIGAKLMLKVKAGFIRWIIIVVMIGAGVRLATKAFGLV